MCPEFRELFTGKRGQRELTIEGEIVFPEGVKRGRLTIQRGKGVIFGVNGDFEPDIVLEDFLIFPGFVDIHVHAREDPSGEWNHKEDFRTAGRAALSGGLTAFADMPNTPQPLTDSESLREKAILGRRAGMPVLLYAAIRLGTRPLKENVPYKVFMGKSVGPLFFRDRKALSETLSRYRHLNVSFHCEDPEILKMNENKDMHSERRPPEAEIRAVEFALELIEEFELKGKICHISTGEGVRLVERARRNGLSVEMEATPHHLLFEDNGNGIEFPECLRCTGERVPEGFFQVNPPIREKRDREALFSAFAGGKIDYLATDHAPHTMEEKLKGASGLPELDTYGNAAGCLLEMGVKPEVLVRAASLNPGEFLGRFMPVRRGIEAGQEANLTVLKRAEAHIEREGLFTKAGWSPFEGCTFQWSVEFTVLRGQGWAVRRF